MKSITPMEAGKRYVMVATAVGGMVCLIMFDRTEPTVLACLFISPTLVVWNGLVIAHRKAFTDAIANMKPLTQIDDQTLFPEEIDPYQARATAAQIYGCVSYQALLAFVFALGGGVVGALIAGH